MEIKGKWFIAKRNSCFSLRFFLYVWIVTKSCFFVIYTSNTQTEIYTYTLILSSLSVAHIHIHPWTHKNITLDPKIECKDDDMTGLELKNQDLTNNSHSCGSGEKGLWNFPFLDKIFLVPPILHSIPTT